MNALAHLVHLVLQRRPLEPLMMLATAFTLYPNFYGFFVMFNYLNDFFYQYLWAQVCRGAARRG